MANRRASVMTAAILGTLVCSSGCVVEEEVDARSIDEEAALENDTQEGPNGIVSGNGALLLTPALVTLYTPVAQLLAVTPLTKEVLEATDLLLSLGGRTFLHYTVKCALPAGDSVTVSALGTSYTFEGAVGLAPEWKTGTLTPSSRRWLSACVLAHVNLTTAEVGILLRGNHPALSSGAEEGLPYTLKEGAFYGDLFGLLPAMHACPGVGSVAERTCTSSLLGLSPCGFTVPGNCSSVCGSTTAGTYKDCRNGLLPLLSTQYPETITVYLQPE